MAIAYQGSADLGNNSGSSNSLTASYTVNAASNLLVVGFLGDLTSGNDDITGVTYNGVSMTLAKKYGPTESPVIRNQYIYFLVNPATGANNVVISSTNTKYIIAVAADYSGAATSGQPDATANAETGATASTITASVITVANNAWAVALSQGYSNGGAPTAGSGADLRTYGPAFGQPGWFDSNGAITPAGSYSMTLNQPSSVQSIAATLVSFATEASSASLSESGTGADTVAAAWAGSVSLAESATAIDTVGSSGQYNASLAESGSGVDTVAGSADATLEEAGSAADTISQNAAFQPSLTETGSGADTLGATTDAVLSEAGSAADTVLLTGTSTTLAETASAADTVSYAGEATATQVLIAGMYPGWKFP